MDVRFTAVIAQIVEHLRVAVENGTRRGDAVAEAQRKLKELASHLREKAS